MHNGCNVYIGCCAGENNQSGTGNVYIGDQAGRDTTSSYKLVISNFKYSKPLIYGEFDKARLTINGQLKVDGNVQPTVNNSFSLGTSALKWTYVYATNGTIQTSDKRYKQNIEPIKDALKSVLKLNGVSYYWRAKEFPNQNFDDKKHIGVIAQEVEAVYPELVVTDENGYKSVSYENLAPVLIEAIKEQQGIIDELKAEVELLKEMVKQLAK